MARRKDEDFDYLEDAFDDKKSEEEMLAAQRASNRGCLISLAVGVFGVLIIAIVSFGAISALLLS